MRSMLETKDLVKYYGSGDNLVKAIDHTSLRIEAGEFTAIVAVRGANGEEILPPCGNCRQILSDYAPDCRVILQTGSQVQRVPARELLPFAYAVED